MRKLRVLVGCEYSGAVRDSFAALGHDAWSCDLLPTDVPGNHIQGDVLEAVHSREWDLFCVHPPCTYLTISAEWAYRDVQTKNIKPGTLIGAERRAAREKALDFVRACWLAPVKHIAMENPVGAISKRIMQPTQYIQPYQFGHDASKKTGLWLKNLPPLRPTSYIEPRMVCQSCGHTFSPDKWVTQCPGCNGDWKRVLPRWANQTDSGQNRLPPSEDRWKIRSETYLGIAQAMADQWTRALCGEVAT